MVRPLDEVFVADKFSVSEQITKEAEAFKQDLLRMSKEEVQPVIEQTVSLNGEVEKSQLSNVVDLEANGMIKIKLEKMAHFYATK